jgi:hypothetical protein
MIPTICPTCRSEVRDGLRCSSSAVVAYHSNSGHVFLIVDEGFRWEEAAVAADQALNLM